MENKDITICLTSCGRFDLLERTIRSLITNWNIDFAPTVLLNEDSGNLLPESIYMLLDAFTAGSYHVLHGNKNQIEAIDRLYSLVQTPYIFHMEDDWEFTKPGFIGRSMDILESNPKIMQVWLREPNDRNGHPASGQVLKTDNGTKYQLMRIGYRRDWNGFSFNPGLRRLSDYKFIGPYSDIASFDPKQPLKAEIEIGKKYLANGFRAATLLTGFCKHIGGNGRHVHVNG